MTRRNLQVVSAFVFEDLHGFQRVDLQG